MSERKLLLARALSLLAPGLGRVVAGDVIAGLALFALYVFLLTLNRVGALWLHGLINFCIWLGFALLDFQFVNEVLLERDLGYPDVRGKLIVGGLLLCLIWLMLPCSTLFFLNRWSADPVWSPDGTRIAYTCHYPTWSEVKWAFEEDLGLVFLSWGHILSAAEVCTIRPDGRDFARLTNSEYGAASNPVWSPDSRWIALYEDGGLRFVSPDGRQSLSGSQRAGLRLAGGLEWFPSAPNAEAGVLDSVAQEFTDVGTLSWNSDETQVAFRGSKEDDAGDPYHEIYIFDPESGEVRCLTEAYDLDVGCWTKWVSAEDRIVFTAGEALYTILPDGSELTQVAELPPNSHSFTLSPDGKSLAFVRGSFEGDKLRIWLLQMETGRMQELRTP